MVETRVPVLFQTFCPHCRNLTVATSLSQLAPANMSLTAPATENIVASEAPSIPANIKPLSLPLEGLFDSYEALFNSAQQYAKDALYAFVIGKTDRRKGRIIRILTC